MIDMVKKLTHNEGSETKNHKRNRAKEGVFRKKRGLKEKGDQRVKNVKMKWERKKKMELKGRKRRRKGEQGGVTRRSSIKIYHSSDGGKKKGLQETLAFNLSNKMRSFDSPFLTF